MPKLLLHILALISLFILTCAIADDEIESNPFPKVTDEIRKRSEELRARCFDETIQIEWDENMRCGMNSHSEDFFAQYNKLLETDGKARGKVVLIIDVSKSGHVESARYIASEISNAEFKASILEVISAIKFREMDNGVSFKYTFQFFPKE